MSAQLAKKHGRVPYNRINKSRYNSGLSEKFNINGQDNSCNYFLRKYGASALIKATTLPNHNSNQIVRQSSRLLLRQRQERLNSGKKIDRSFQKEVINRRVSLRNKEKLLTSLIIPAPEVETSSVIASDSIVYVGTLYNRHPGFGDIQVIDLTKSSSNITVVVNGNQKANELKEHDTHLSLDKRDSSLISIHQSNTELSSDTDSHHTNNHIKKKLIRRGCCSEDLLKFKNKRNTRAIDTISNSSDSSD